MKLKVHRRYKGPLYTIGSLYIDGVYFCDTLEDIDRGLTKDMPLATIKRIKVKGSTCIPYGTYKITLNVVSPKYSNYKKYPFAYAVKAKIPRLLDVPGFDGVLIHPGNTQNDTDGCLLVGENKVKGSVINSINTWKALYNKLSAADKRKESITIEYSK